MEPETPSSGLPLGKRVPANWAALIGAIESDTAGNSRRYLGYRAKLSLDEFVKTPEYVAASFVGAVSANVDL